MLNFALDNISSGDIFSSKYLDLYIYKIYLGCKYIIINSDQINIELD